ncbi:MAG: carboxypeptidase-like regulatory domain-containing protein [Acidobacteriia bacterium]|nr:carboxypeptidase-like regulatory domain-containing protein [Terriglobia bacterium]
MRINGRMWMGFIAVLAAVVLLAAPAQAQKTTGTILGTVMDPSGGAVAGAQVTAKNTATSFERSASTDSSGYYRIDLLPAGSYTVSVEKPGFKRQVLTGIILQIDQDARIDTSMQLGEVSQQIEVSSAPPLADTTTATIGDVIENRRIVNLPLNGRNFQQLALLTAGTASGQQGGTQDFFGTAAGSIGFVVNGGRDDQNNFLVDGINVIDHYFNSLTLTPSIDAIQEFKVLQNSYSAEAGMFGSGQINITTKSGANDIHGSAFEFLRNHNLDSKNFFDLPGRNKPAFHQNSFGFSLGGPVKKDKTFWFVTYEGLRVRQAQTVLSSLLTADQRNGLFTGLNACLTDPNPADPSGPFVCSGGPGAGTFQTQIPVGRFGPVANAMLADFFPVPNLYPNTPGLNNVSVDKRTEDRDQFVARFDHRLNDKHSLFARYIWARSDQSFPFGKNILTFDPAPPPGFPTPVPDKSQNMALGVTSSLRTNLLNELRLGWNFYDGKRLAGNSVNFPQTVLGLPAGPFTNIAPTDLGYPAFHLAGISQFGDSDVFNPLFRKDRVLQVSDNLIWTRGRHSMKFGGDIRDVRLDTLSNFFTRGFPNFDGVSLTGSFIADFLLDRPFFNVRTIGDTTGNFVTHLWGMYANDEWRATSRLTMTLGVRYEIFPPIYEKNNRIAVYDAASQSIIIPGSTLPASVTDPTGIAQTYNLLLSFYGMPPVKYVTGDSLGLGRSITKTDFKRIAPRIGLAYDLTGNGKTVIRAAFGIFNALRDYSASSDSRNMPPFALQMLALDFGRFGGPAMHYSDVYQGFAPGLPPVGNLPAGGIGPQVNMPIGYSEQYTLNLQHQIGQNFSIEAAYVGVTGINLNRLTSSNQIHLSGPLAGLHDNAQFGTFIQEASGATSSYHGGFVRAEKRMSQGLAFVASYTFSKSIDTVSSARENGGAPTREQDAFCLKCDRGLSNFDIRNRFVASFTYDLPFGPGHTYMHDVSGAMAKLLGGWQAGGIVTLQGGQPFTPQYPGGSSSIRFPRPSQDGSGNLPAGQRDPSQWFDPNVYYAPAAIAPFGEASAGNSGRNTLIGPSYKDVDFNLQKDTAIGERLKVQFRAELFNLFNHPNFNLPDRVFSPTPGCDPGVVGSLLDPPNATCRNSNPNFGKITSARLPRVVQFGLKFTF